MTDDTNPIDIAALLDPSRPRKDYTWLVEKYRAAADKGDADAQQTLGFYYSIGFFLPQDDELAYMWVKKAVEQGNAEAQALLGLWYATGLVVSQDAEQAQYWLEKAAALGSESAKKTLEMLSDASDSDE